MIFQQRKASKCPIFFTDFAKQKHDVIWLFLSCGWWTWSSCPWHRRLYRWCERWHGQAPGFHQYGPGSEQNKQWPGSALDQYCHNCGPYLECTQNNQGFKYFQYTQSLNILNMVQELNTANMLHQTIWSRIWSYSQYVSDLNPSLPGTLQGQDCVGESSIMTFSLKWTANRVSW